MLPRAAWAATVLFLVPTAVWAITFEREALGVPTMDGELTLEVEIADTAERRARGYMERTDIGPTDGMLFVFDPPRNVSMWMQSTPTSLDMIFVRADGTVSSIATDTVPYSTSVISAEEVVPYVLEVLAGSAERWGLEAGDRLASERFTD